jgi:translation initiation factor 2B subunit (eIF-2B alpha/beta/delta family)
MDLSEFNKRIEIIASDKISGAFNLCLKTAEIFRDASTHIPHADFESLVDHAFAAIGRSHAEMPSLLNLLNIIRCIRDRNEPQNILYDSLQSLIGELSGSAAKVTGAAYPILSKYDHFLSISNSGLAAAAFENLEGRRRYLRVYICESRPGDESIKMAERLLHSGIEAIIIPDSSVASIIDSRYCVVIGCDAVSPTHFRNKIGSLQLALIADALKAPFFVLADMLKFVDDITTIKKPSEWIYRGDDGLKHYHRLFEDVPISLASGIVTPDGLKDPRDIPQYIKMIKNVSRY